jgi:hypothetical protein
MHRRARGPAVQGAVVVLIILVMLSLGFAGEAAARSPQQKPAEKKFDKVQTQEIQALVKLVTDVTLGAPAPSDFPITWQNHYLKARDQRTFVPYAVTIPAGTFASPSVVLYVRVVRKGSEPDADAAKAGGEGAPPAAGLKDSKAAQRLEFAFEDVYFTDLKTPEGKDPYRLVRALSVLPGEYTVYFALRERPAADKKGTAAPKTSLIKQAMTVPDFWQPGLVTSSIIIADKVDLLSTTVPESQIAENPYDFGKTRVFPAAPNHRFSKKQDLSIIFLVYNTAEVNKKPDVVVEYAFSQKAENGEKPFNKTNPQVYNAETLPPAFDMAAGHQIVAGQSVPLASFPEGDYRLEIRITDKIAGKTIVQSVNFTVTQ